MNAGFSYTSNDVTDWPLAINQRRHCCGSGPVPHFLMGGPMEVLTNVIYSQHGYSGVHHDRCMSTLPA